jgi:tryptophan synthase alpha subunit
MAADMTDEEYDALDEEMTKADLHLTPVVGPVTRQKRLLDALDEETRNYIISKTVATGILPSGIIAEMVREKIANANLLGDANAVGEVSEVSVAKV